MEDWVEPLTIVMEFIKQQNKKVRNSHNPLSKINDTWGFYFV